MRRYKPEKIHKVIFKLSGEVLAGEKGFGINMQCVEELIDDLISIRKAGYSIGIVIGGGNFFRGVSEVGNHINRYTADKVAKFYTPNRATTSLNEGKICFFCGGIGNPFFTTDTAAILRAIELNADLVLKGTKVDGVFSADPVKDKNAKFIADITFSEVIDKELQVMDMTAFSLARENNMPIKIFNITKKGSLKEAILNKDVGTFVHK